MNEIDLNDTQMFGLTPEEAMTEKAIIKVIGVGGGGGNAVNYMFAQNIPDINYVVVNTDKQALKGSKVPNRMVIGWSITHGRGAGNNPDVGRQCAEADEAMIRELFDKDTEMVFITAGMGGGTGTGAAPVVARLAKEAGKLTIGIVSVPFLFEGEKKILKAIDGASEMKKHVDALLVVNNQNLLDIYPDLNFFNAFGKVDDTLANAARSISEIISEPCYINVDFEDVKTTLINSGTAIISTAIGEGKHRISEAIRNALHSPLLKRHDIKTSKRLLLKFSCSAQSENAITAKEINEIQAFTAQLPSTIDVKWGIADNPTMGDAVKVTVLASGFDVTLNDNIVLDAETGTAKNNDSLRAANEELHEGGISFTDEQPAKKPNTKRDIADIYGQTAAKEMDMTRLKMRCLVLTPSEFDDDEVISRLEREPTKNRDSHINDSIHEAHRAGNELRAPKRSASNASNLEAGAITF